MKILQEQGILTLDADKLKKLIKRRFVKDKAAMPVAILAAELMFDVISKLDHISDMQGSEKSKLRQALRKMLILWQNRMGED